MSFDVNPVLKAAHEISPNRGVFGGEVALDSGIVLIVCFDLELVTDF